MRWLHWLCDEPTEWTGTLFLKHAAVFLMLTLASFLLVGLSLDYFQ